MGKNYTYHRPEKRMGPTTKGYYLPIEERFWKYVKKGKKTACWNWKGSLNSKSKYGYIYYKGSPKPAHRISYMLQVGEIPKGLVLDHLCNNPSCVNPHHLEPCTQQINTQRAKDLRKPPPIGEFFKTADGITHPIYLSKEGRYFIRRRSASGSKYNTYLIKIGNSFKFKRLKAFYKAIKP